MDRGGVMARSWDDSDSMLTVGEVGAIYDQRDAATSRAERAERERDEARAALAAVATELDGREPPAHVMPAGYPDLAIGVQELRHALTTRAERAENERAEARAQLEIVRQGFHAATCADYPECTDLAHETDHGRAVAVADEQRRAACDERDDARNERERAEAAIQRVRALLAEARLASTYRAAGHRYVTFRLDELDAALDGTDNTGGTDD